MFKQKTNSASKEKSETESLHFGGLTSIFKHESVNQDSLESISNVNSEPKIQNSSNKSMLLIQEIQKLHAQTINPLIDYSNGDIIYPILSKIGEAENNISYLDNLTSDGILTKTICEKLIVCPKHPNIFSSNMRLYCPKCNSINIEKLNLFEHKQCGYISESKNFDFSNIENSNCPSCKKIIKNFEKEIRMPAMWYQCVDCVEKFDNAVIKLHCKKDEHDFDINSGKFVPTYSYTLKNSDVSNISDTTQIKNELVELLVNFNFTAELNFFMKGKSGNTHEIPIFCKNKSNGDIILIFIKNQTTPINESDMNSILIPKLDISPKYTLFVTVSDIQEGVETIANHYGINLIHDHDFSKIISHVIEFLTVWYTHDGDPK